MYNIYVQRFWERVSIAGPDECWVWLRGTNNHGYGVFYAPHQIKAHRFSCELHNGPIPKGKWVLHSCDNPPCVNPAHLRIGTPLDNSRDRDSRGRTGDTSRTKNGRHKLTEADVTYIRRNPDMLLQRELGAKFGVTQVMISKVQLHQNWR